jgi:predicted HicB family RNase H-like nuclease
MERLEMTQTGKRKLAPPAARMSATIRFPLPLYERVNAAAQAAGVPRNEWMLTVFEAVLATASERKGEPVATAAP